MNKITYQAMKQRFRTHEAAYPKTHLTGYIVFAPESFTKPYSLESRTYMVSSGNKAFRPNMGGYSIFATSLDKSDPYVRLEQYMAEEQGGSDGWVVDYCYMAEDDTPPWEE